MTSFCYAQNEAYTIMAKSDGSLVIPDKATFFSKNVRAFQQDFRIFVDTTPSPESEVLSSSTWTAPNPFYYKTSNNEVTQTLDSNGRVKTTYAYVTRYYQLRWWTDCEVKVIDKWGNLVYFTSTIMLNSMQVQQLHPILCDSTPKIFAWVAVGSNGNGGCWGQRVEHTIFNASIGSEIASKFGSAISGIWIYPDVSSTTPRLVPIYTGANIYTDKMVVWGEYVREVFNNPDNTILVWRQTTSAGELYNGNKLWRPARLEYYGDFKEVTK